MRITTRIAAIGLIGVALMQFCFGGECSLLASRPELHWLAQSGSWFRWPLAAVNLWLAIRLWRNPNCLTSSSVRSGGERRVDVRT